MTQHRPVEFVMGGEPPADARGGHPPHNKSALREALDANPGIWFHYNGPASAITHWKRNGYEALSRKNDGKRFTIWVRRPA